MNKFRGTGPALITPMNNDGSVDYKSLEKLVNNVISNKVEFVVVFGTTGEPVTLSEDEKKDVYNCVVSTVAGRVPIIAGCGGNNTHEVVKKLESGFFNNADAILSVSPYYNKPNQRGIFEHYKVVAKASPVPVIVYNVPGRTGANIQAATTIKISKEIENVIGIKEASPSVEQFTYILKDVPKDFLVISGDDSLIVPHISLGASGAISVTANAFPGEYSQMVRYALDGNFAKARILHFKLIEFTDHLFIEGSPAGVKAALSIMGMVKNNVRLPLTTVTEETYKKISALIDKVRS